jgi:hypothetical protein
MARRRVPALITALLAAGTPAGVLAQEVTEPALYLELNGAQASDKGCRLTFLVRNDLGADVDEASYEIALFDEAGVVGSLAVLAFKDLPAGKTRVTRFDLPAVDCGKISRVLVNHATQCTGAGLEPAACMRRLKIGSKAAIAFDT